MSQTSNQTPLNAYYRYCMEMEEEYRKLLVKPDGTVEDDDARIRQKLRDDEWSENGADALVMLTRQYGSFILRNALAMARVMNIEDGELGL